MIAREKQRGMKSIKCACGRKTALLEKPNQLAEDKNVFKLHDTRNVHI